MEYRSFRHNVTPGRASWLERILAAIVTLALLVLGFFFPRAVVVVYEEAAARTRPGHR